MRNRKLRYIRPSGAFFTVSDSHVTGRGPVRPYFFPVLFFRTFFSYFFSVLFFCTFPPVLFSRTFFPFYFFLVLLFPVLFFPYFFSRIFFPVLFFPAFFFRTFSKVATFEIQRFKISVSCFSSTCRYNTVHVPYGISIQTSSVGQPLHGWCARMRDLKGPKMNLFKAKED